MTIRIIISWDWFQIRYEFIDFRYYNACVHLNDANS